MAGALAPHSHILALRRHGARRRAFRLAGRRENFYYGSNIVKRLLRLVTGSPRDQTINHPARASRPPTANAQ